MIAAAVAGGLFLSKANERNRRRAELRRVVTGDVSNAVVRAEEAINRSAEEFREFILSKRDGSRAFAKEVTSLTGKWRAIKPYLPGTDGDGHKEYIKEVFERDVLSSGELGGALKRAIDGAVRDVEGIQNELAVTLRREIGAAHLNEHEVNVVQDEFRESIRKLVGASQNDTVKAVAASVGSGAAGDVATAVLARLGVEAGILATGAGDSWWSFGASLVIALLVDAVWTWIDDPVGKIESEVKESLDKMAENGKIALVAELRKVVLEKKDVWQTAANDLVAHEG